MNRKRGKLEPTQLQVPSGDAVPSSAAGSLDGCTACWWLRGLHFMDLLHFLKKQAKKKKNDFKAQAGFLLLMCLHILINNISKQ